MLFIIIIVIVIMIKSILPMWKKHFMSIKNNKKQGQ